MTKESKFDNSTAIYDDNPCCDSNPGSSVLEADAMTTMPRRPMAGELDFLCLVNSSFRSRSNFESETLSCTSFRKNF
jgi:hypothetical protein